MTLKIGILKCGHVAAPVAQRNGDYVAWFRNILEPQGLTLVPYAVVDMEFPNSLDEADGWLLTGSPLSAYEDHPFIAPLMQLIRDIQAAGKPMVGICFGHQIIARALGGEVRKADVGVRIGPQTYDIKGLGPVTLNAWHQDQVTRAPEGAHILASRPDVPVGAMGIGGTTLTLQTHPELTNTCVLDLIDLRRDAGTFAPGQLEEAEAKAETPTDGQRTAKWIAEFYRDTLARAQAPAGYA